MCKMCNQCVRCIYWKILVFVIHETIPHMWYVSDIQYFIARGNGDRHGPQKAPKRQSAKLVRSTGTWWMCRSRAVLQSVEASKRPKASKQVLLKHKFWYRPCLLCTLAISSMTMDQHVLDLSATMSHTYHVSRNLMWIGAAKVTAWLTLPAFLFGAAEWLSSVACPRCPLCTQIGPRCAFFFGFAAFLRWEAPVRECHQVVLWLRGFAAWLWLSGFVAW